jgi:hypothetical protein
MFLIAVMAGELVAAHVASAVEPLNPSRPCSVFDSAPCNPSHCGVNDPWPCVPEFPSNGQDLRLTIHSRNAETARAPEGPVDSIRALFVALRGCWQPPPSNEAFRGMQMSVRFSFTRAGETVAPPRLTYATSEANADTRRIYRTAIDAALALCTPMPFSPPMGAAIAGRPIAIRFIDDRE